MAHLMKCGHIANGYKKNEENKLEPYCIICDCGEIEKEVHGTEGLENRQAICTQHKGASNNPVPSNWELPFFEYRPNEKYDKYYCGCWGWD